VCFAQAGAGAAGRGGLAASKGFACAQLPVQRPHSPPSVSSFPIASSTNESPWQRQRKKYTPVLRYKFQ